MQCKSGVLRNGCVLFRLYSVSGHDTRPKPYGAAIDAFGVYCRETSTTYLVPVAVLDGQATMAALRVEPARNGQRRGIRTAQELVID